MNQNKIIPGLWYCTEGGRILKIVEYYKNIFDADFEAGSIIPLGETPSGNTEMCEVNIFGQKYSLMTTEKEHHPLNDAFSLIIYCENQKEIDKYWDYFTKDGQASQCGWCIDKFGLRWQILPQNFEELMNKPNGAEVMMAQTKIIINEYQ